MIALSWIAAGIILFVGLCKPDIMDFVFKYYALGLAGLFIFGGLFGVKRNPYRKNELDD